MTKKGFGPITLGNFIQRVRTMFKYGFEAELIDVPVRFGWNVVGGGDNTDRSHAVKVTFYPRAGFPLGRCSRSCT